MSKTIELVLKSSKTFGDDISEERQALTSEKGRLASLYQNLLPVEAEARTQIKTQIDVNEKRIRLLDTAVMLGGLPMLDLGVFAWTKPQQGWRKTFGWRMIDVPVLAYIRVNQSSCRLKVDHRGRTEVNGHLLVDALPVSDYYQTILDNLRSRYLSWDGRETITLTYTYPGIVPDHIKEIIQEETKTKKFTELAFVCDVDRWQVGVTKPPPREFFDPILVGEKNGALWVLASFDPTTVEEYLLREFTS